MNISHLIITGKDDKNRGKKFNMKKRSYTKPPATTAYVSYHKLFFKKKKKTLTKYWFFFLPFEEVPGQKSREGKDRGLG